VSALLPNRNVIDCVGAAIAKIKTAVNTHTFRRMQQIMAIRTKSLNRTGLKNRRGVLVANLFVLKSIASVFRREFSVGRTANASIAKTMSL